jgi:acyl-homoserine-lactone acylase
MGYMKYNNNRGIRFQDQMEAAGKIDYAQFKTIKYDRRYPDSLYVFYIDNINDIFSLSPQEYPEIASGIEILKQWDRNTNPENQGATFMLLVNEYLWKEAMKKHIAFERTHWNDQQFALAIDYATEHLMKHFGTLNVPLGDLQRHVRGDKDWPLGGGPDVLAAMYAKEWKKGRRRGFLGDSYIQLIRFTKEGVKIESTNCYGSSNHSDSPHYDDQVPLFLNQELKTMTLDKETILREAERVYHPD